MFDSRLRSRYLHLMRFFIRLTSALVFWEVLLPAVGLRQFTSRTRPRRLRGIAASFRGMAIRMGGVMIKVGQFLSARMDVLPEEVTEELSGLQDEVPPERFDAIKALAEAELGAPLQVIFERFDVEPLAAASLGQVHLARLRPDAPEARIFRDVVVKIQRPFIGQLIDVDFAALRRFGSWLQHYRPLRRRVDVLSLIKELSDVVHREIDYLAEGKNAETFAANFAGRKRVRVPRVAWSHTNQRVLTLENVYAIKITDHDLISAAGIERAQVATALFDTYLKQIFEDHFFHADPHPGNLFVAPVPAAQGRKVGWKLTFVDFGMVGAVPDELQRGLREMLVGVGTRDAAKVVRAYETLGVLLPGADRQLLEKAESQLFERFWGMSMRDLRRVHHAEMHEFAMQFRELMYAMPFQLPHNLLLLGRTLAILSGMCTGLDPDFNVWQHLAPYARKLIADEGASDWNSWLDQVGELARQVLALPSRAGTILTRLEQGELKVDAPKVSRQLYHLESAVNRLVGSVVFTALLFGGLLLYRSGQMGIAYVFWVVSTASLLWMFLVVRGHPPGRD